MNSLTQAVAHIYNIYYYYYYYY